MCISDKHRVGKTTIQTCWPLRYKSYNGVQMFADFYSVKLKAVVMGLPNNFQNATPQSLQLQYVDPGMF